jgi:hypothetical protein
MVGRWVSVDGWFLVAREPVGNEDKGRGYEYAKNAYILVDDDELDAVAVESTHTIEIDSFVPREQIDERYLDSPYYITPDDKVGQDAFAVIREAMRGKGMVALARVVLSKRERVIMLQPWDKGLMGTTLRYPYEIRDAKEYFDDIPNVKVAPDMLKLAEHILQSKKADFDPSQFVDHYEDAVVYSPVLSGRHPASSSCSLPLNCPLAASGPHGQSRNKTPASSCVTTTGRRSPMSIARMNRDGDQRLSYSRATRRGALRRTLLNCQS